MIIDTHQHLGTSMFSGVETTAAGLLHAMDQHGVDLALVMPQPTREDIRACHDRIAEAVRRNPGRLLGMASIDPWWSVEDHAAEARRCVRELGFVALKLHPLGHNLAANHPAAAKTFQLASELDVPVIVHTGLGCPWALPSLCIPPARAFPNVPIVLAHAGWGVYTAEAMVTAEVCPNVVLEASWCPSYAVRSMLDKFGPDRMVFGSDHLSNLPVELVKYRTVCTEEELSRVLGATARRVFRLTDQR